MPLQGSRVDHLEWGRRAVARSGVTKTMHIARDMRMGVCSLDACDHVPTRFPTLLRNSAVLL